MLAAALLASVAAWRASRPTPVAPLPAAVAPAPTLPEPDAGLDLQVAIAEPKGPRVCVLAGKLPVAGAQIVAAGFHGTADSGGCVDLPPPATRDFTVCARAARGAACERSTRLGDAWLPVTLRLESAGKLRVDVGNLRGKPVAAFVTVSYGDAPFTEPTSVNGVAMFDRLPVGKAMVGVEAKGSLSEPRKEAQVPRSDLARVRFALAPASPLSGVLLGPSGCGVGWQRIEAISAIDATRHLASHRGDAGFVFDDVAEGPYDLRVEAEGFARALIPVAAPAEKLKLVLEPGYPLDVTVLGTQGEPLSDAPLTLSGGQLTASTGDGGIAHIDGLPAHPVRLIALPPDGYRCRAGVSQEITPGPELAQVTLQFTEGKTIAGTLVNAKGAPVAGEVWATSNGSSHLDDATAASWLSAHATTLDGHFTLSCLRDGDYLVGARVTGGLDSQLRASKKENVRAGTHDVRLQLATGATARAKVTDAKGRPLENLSVNGSEEMEFPGGAFEVNVKAGETSALVISAKGYLSKRVEVTVADGEQIDLGVVRLARASYARVTLIDRASHLGVEGATVATAPDAGIELDPAFSSSIGEAQVPCGDKPLTVRVQHPGYLPLEATINPAEPTTLELDPGASAHGRVIDRRGDSMYDVQVTARHGELIRTAELANDGTFNVRGLAAGEWTFTASPARTDRSRPLGVDAVKAEVSAGANVEVNLSERRTGADLTVETGTENAGVHLAGSLLRGVVPCPAIAGELYRLRQAADYEGKQVRGAYLFAGIPAGEYTFVLGTPAEYPNDEVVLCHAEPIRVSGDGLMRWTAHPRPVTLRAE